jgi:excisionase family DNA binding protein
MTANITVHDSPTSPHWRAAPIPKIAKMLGVSERMVRYLVRSGKLPVYRSGRAQLVLRTDVLNLLDRRFAASQRQMP